MEGLLILVTLCYKNITISRLLNAINGNVDLCKAMEVKVIPEEYLEWVISNYNEKLIPIQSLETALNYVDLTADDVKNLIEDVFDDEESLEDLMVVSKVYEKQ